MRFLNLVVAIAALVAGTAFASPTDPKSGAEYTMVTPPQPVQVAGKKVEVIEFFMYHCPHCNALEPTLAEWVKKQGDNVVFKRVHFPHPGTPDSEAHLYLTLEAMGKLDTMHEKVFHAWHVEHQRMDTDEKTIEWVAKNGIDKAKFLEYFNSFGVLTKLKRLSQIVANYKVEVAPTLVVDGRYMVSPATVSAANPSLRGPALETATTEVLDALVARVMKDNGVKPATKAAAK